MLDFFDMGEGLGSALRRRQGGFSVRTVGLAGLQGLSSVASAMADMGQIQRRGQAEKDAHYLSAMDEITASYQPWVTGQGEIMGLRQKLVDTLGSRLVGAGASRIDGGQGVIQDNAAVVSRRAIASADIARTNAAIKATRHRINAITEIMRGDEAERAANAEKRARLGTGILSGLMSLGGMFL